jgi:hypothetical protein
MSATLYCMLIGETPYVSYESEKVYRNIPEGATVDPIGYYKTICMGFSPIGQISMLNPDLQNLKRVWLVRTVEENLQDHVLYSFHLTLMKAVEYCWPSITQKYKEFLNSSKYVIPDDFPLSKLVIPSCHTIREVQVI